jgi:50S ribosomal subunit-associated GTPase HflX
MTELLSLVEQELNRSHETCRYKIPHHRYELVAKLREQGCVSSELTDESGILIEASPRGKLKSLLKDYIN